MRPVRTTAMCVSGSSVQVAGPRIEFKGRDYTIPAPPFFGLGVVSLVRRDGIAIAALLLLVATIVGPVFANVGKPTPQGLAYRAYFIADLFAHMSVVAELVKQATPPINPYFPR